MNSGRTTFSMDDLIGSIDMADLLKPEPMRQSRPRQWQRPVLQNWAITRFGLGYKDRDGAFSVEYSYNLGQHGKLETDPNNRRVIILGGQVELQISDFSIEQISVVGSSPNKVIFTLDYSPFFGSRNLAGQLTRDRAIDPEHASLGQVINRQVLVTFRDGGERQRFCNAERRRGIPKPRFADINLVSRGLFSAAQMRKVEDWMNKLSGPIGFQVSKPRGRVMGSSAVKADEKSFRWQVASLVSSGLMTPQEMIKLSSSITAVGTQRGPKQAERVLQSFAGRLRRAATQARPHSPKKQPTKSLAQHFDDAKHQVAAALADKPIANMSMTRFAVVTPTGIDLDGPVAEQSNATLRLYPQHHDLFLRVSFREEDHSNFSFSSEWAVLEFLMRRFQPIFIDGLRVAGRTFHFLGWSSAGLKEQTALFVAPFRDGGTPVTADMIRQRMGNFTKSERIPAKWMARIGQNFSTSKHAVTLDPEQITIIDDLAPPNSPWIYTDGVGTISLLLARDIEAALNADASSYDLGRRVASTCYQVRIGGAKGMLSIDPTLTGRKVCLRRSMIKFETNQSVSVSLNIAGSFGRPSPAFTNRPLIQVLEGLGVPAEEFYILQRAAIKQTEQSKSSWAGMAKLLSTVDLGRAARLPSVVDWLAPLLAEQGKAAIEDNFFQQCTNLAVMHSHRQLKFRARIPLPGCWTLVGIVDEEPGGFLAEDEIYACVHEPGKEPVYLEGPVIISRSPVVHPGDVRIVRAVGRVHPRLGPKIAAQENCVVFSVKGARPLPSMLGGGDCDGDQYQLITRLALIPRRLVPAGGYEAPKPEVLSRKSTVADAANFFLNFVMLDCIGQVSKRHLLWADYSEDGIMSTACMLLAKAQ